MSYQIIGIRTRYNERARKDTNFDAFYEMRWRFDSPSEIFLDPIGVMDRNKIPEHERFNLYYTVANCTDDKRKMARLEQIAFDIDGIDPERIEEYIDPILAVLAPAQPTVVSSGNGLHFLLPISNAITTAEEHSERKPQYLALLNKINSVLEKLKLRGKPDPTMWDMARILRIPETLNRKVKAGAIVERRCVVLRQGSHSPIEFDWDKVSGFKKGDALTAREMRRFRKHDGTEAFLQCGFLQHAKSDAASLPEPQWYAAASIIGRFDKGAELFHEISKAHHGYSASATDDKLKQALTNSGPVTCRKINDLWGKCTTCPLFEKITSPVVIMSDTFIRTEKDGYYDVIEPSEPGKAVKLVPNYGDLLKAFKREYSYFTHTKIEKAVCFDTTHWRHFGEIELHGYAEKTFSPPPKHTYRNEFARKVLSSEQWTTAKADTFLRSSTRGKVNLKNGVLDIFTRELTEHSPDYGFTYVLPYEYDPNASAPVFEKFLADVTCGSEDFAASLLDFMAYLFIPEIEDHCYLWLEGSGRNGKSTFMRVLQWLVGDENTSAVMLDQFDEPNMLETMNHKLLNIAEESDSRKVSGKVMSGLKNLSAGSMVQVHQKYELPYAMKPTAKMVFASNIRPRFDGAGQAVASRMILVPFKLRLENYRDKTASKVDNSITSRLRAELPGILNLVLERLELQGDNETFRVHRAKESSEEVQQLLVESDAMEAWLEDCTELDAEAKTTSHDLHESYKRYMQEHHPKEFVLAARQFSTTLAAKLHGSITKVQVGASSLRGFAGVSLKKGPAADY